MTWEGVRSCRFHARYRTEKNVSSRAAITVEGHRGVFLFSRNVAGRLRATRTGYRKRRKFDRTYPICALVMNYGCIA